MGQASCCQHGGKVNIHQRSSQLAALSLRCAERVSAGQTVDRDCPVRLVVFDLDETITMVTFMSKSGTYPPAERKHAADVNFETPWVEGSRIDKLKQMLVELASERALAILTRNQNKGGVEACLNLLRLAGLDTPFCAIWTMPWREDVPNGAYKEGTEWKTFDPPVDEVVDHKADVLEDIVANPARWFPQMNTGQSCPVEIKGLSELKNEAIVLVDDQRSNFQSHTGASCKRFAKVARYDATYHGQNVDDMGGIGAHSDGDYESLKMFVEEPWMCKEDLQAMCVENNFARMHEENPVTLIVFDFDETITLATFLPDECNQPEEGDSGGLMERIVSGEIFAEKKPRWSDEDLVKYNFQTPWVRGSRVEKLRKLFRDLATGVAGATSDEGPRPRVLAILTKNEGGVPAVLRLLQLAGLDEHFSAIWTIPERRNIPNGAYRSKSGVWEYFDPPVGQVPHHKADVLSHVAQHPEQWFPQLRAFLAGDESSSDESSSESESLEQPGLIHCLCNVPGPKPTNGSSWKDDLVALRPESICLVDDERVNFKSEVTQARVLRFCKVARYDGAYRDCGTLNQMGGLGAHSDVDYTTLVNFIAAPWDYPLVQCGGEPFKGGQSAAVKFFENVARTTGFAERSKVERTRTS